jgi:hypothetical protein
MKGVIDRIENGTAVVLAEKHGREFVVDAESLPEDAEEGVWLDLEVKGDKIVSAEVNKKETERRRDTASRNVGELKNASDEGSVHDRVE